MKNYLGLLARLKNIARKDNMATHDFRCKECGEIMEDVFVKMSEDLSSIKCEECGGETENLSFGGLGAVFKGLSWATKNLRVKAQKKDKNKRLEKKQREEHCPMKLVPNVGGVEADSFKDAAKIAKEAGLDHRGYESYAQKEKSQGRYEKPH